LQLDLLNRQDLQRFHELGCEKRQMEFYYTRILWQHFEHYQPISYNINGKPFIENGYLSISHSKNVVAISHSSSHKVGVDVEHYNPKIRRIKNKFTSETEVANLDLTNEVNLTTVWSVKEAVYKMLGIPGISFKNSLRVSQIGEKNIIHVMIPDQKAATYEFYRRLFDGYILTYCHVAKN
jgi:phosphopantetheinyl transferase